MKLFIMAKQGFVCRSSLPLEKIFYRNLFVINNEYLNNEFSQFIRQKNMLNVKTYKLEQ